MPESDMIQLTYLTIILAVVGYWAFSSYGGNWRRMGRTVMIWIAIFAVVIVIADTFSLSVPR